MVTRRLVWGSFALSLAVLSGCGELKKRLAKEGDASTEAVAVQAVATDAAAQVEPAPTAAPALSALPTAANLADVARFADEKPVDNAPATVARTANVRDIPGVGKIVATLSNGATVVQVAQRGAAFLVAFDHPKDGRHLMGWVGQEAFVAPATSDAGVKPLACTTPEVPLITDAPFCGRTCKLDTDCPSGQACKGAANRFANSKMGEAVLVCTATPTAGDAGAPAKTRDAGAPTDAGAVDAAASPTPIPVPNVDVAPPVAGQCAVGFELITKDGMCHKRCVSHGCRPATRFCAPCQGVKVCTASLTFCK
jgi:hypothetical protein